LKYCYANRRHVLYPDANDSWRAAPAAYTDEFLDRTREMGFDGIEIGIEVLEATGGDRRNVTAFTKRLAAAKVPVVALRSGGSLTDGRYGPANQERLARAIKLAGWAGIGIVNGALSAPPRYPGKPLFSPGFSKSQDSSREASLADYRELAAALRKACDLGAADGVTISVEVHQNSIVDNSWSAVRTVEMVDRKNFGINPDLGNIFWVYDVPEETCEAAIKALASHSVYWHCKNLIRVHHPENERTVFLRVPIPDGEIDYRFAISAMVAADYPGYMAIEGVQSGDQFHGDGKSIAYAKGVVADLEKRARKR
jgi:sugar phosphate isomerase/epimerase